MPVKEIKKDGKVIGYKWGKSGKMYTVSKYGKEEAKKRAGTQGSAAYASGYKRGKK